MKFLMMKDLKNGTARKVKPQEISKVAQQDGKVVVTIKDELFVSPLGLKETEAWRMLGSSNNNSKIMNEMFRGGMRR
ncbi:MAG: hypothetical protein ACOYL6_17010 [Bacteriovoracaceae bacterium]